MDEDGRIVVPPQYSYLGDYSEGRISVSVGDKVGYLDADGALAIPPAYDNARPFSEGLAAVRVGKLWGFVNAVGDAVIPPQYQGPGIFQEGLACVQLQGSPAKFACVDTGGQAAFEVPSSYYALFSESLAAVSVRNRWGSV